MEPRIVLVRRETEYESLLKEHGTAQMARFQLSQRGVNFDEVQRRHSQVAEAAETALGRVPTTWRKSWTLRRDLDRFRFDPEDVVVAVGWDGLVPNVAKYLGGQPVIGINPFGIEQRMMHFEISEISELYAAGDLKTEARTMVEASMEDGRSLTSLNEVFCGHRSHQSAKYDISYAGLHEYQSSSGLIVTSGTGATGWALSIAEATGVEEEQLPAPTDRRCFFLVREAWASSFTGTDIVRGDVTPDEPLKLTSKMQEGGCIFGDGIESDRLEFRWGQTVTFRVAEQSLNLVIPG